MKKILLAGVAALLLATGTAHAVDILIVVLEKTDNGTDGLHQTQVQDCKQFLQTVRQKMKARQTVRLTIIAEPEVTGDVRHAVCIYPDGSKEEVIIGEVS
jgi:hypothetical protein